MAITQSERSPVAALREFAASLPSMSSCANIGLPLAIARRTSRSERPVPDRRWRSSQPYQDQENPSDADRLSEAEIQLVFLD